MKQFALFAALLVAAPLCAEPGERSPKKQPAPEPAVTLKLPKDVKGEPNTFTFVKADTTAGTVVWYLITPGLNLLPSDMLKDSKTLVVVGPPGAYRVLCYVPVAGVAPAETTVTIGVPPPPPPPPPPPDPLPAALQAAYALEVDAAKAAQVTALASLYKVAAVPSGAIYDPALKTTADLVAKMHAAAGALIPDTALPKVRRAVADELNKVLSPVQPLTDAKRVEVATVFQRVAAALGSLTAAQHVPARSR